MFEIKAIEKIKTRILCSITFSRKSRRLVDNFVIYGGARQARDDDIIRHMCSVCWITKAAHSEFVILLFHGKDNSGFANAPQWCGTRRLYCLSCRRQNRLICFEWNGSDRLRTTWKQQVVGVRRRYRWQWLGDRGKQRNLCYFRAKNCTSCSCLTGQTRILIGRREASVVTAKIHTPFSTVVSCTGGNVTACQRTTLPLWSS
jgi:hypothetical protein